MRTKKLLAMMLVRNEASRYLREVLDDLAGFVDEMLIVDDASTDSTPDICASYANARVIRRAAPSFMNEIVLRKLCWQEAVRAGPEWILAIDADEMFEDRMKGEIDQLLDNDEVDGWAFRLYDCWGSRDHYRDDRYWQAHRQYRVFLVRNTHLRPRWRETPLHCGRLPLNPADPSRVARSAIRLKHLGWANPAEHGQKYAHYIRSDPQGIYGSLPQYASILDPRPRLKRWAEAEPPETKRVLVGSPVRQKPAILRLFLESLRRLEQSAVDLDFTFADDNVDPESSALLDEFAAAVPGVEVHRPGEEEEGKEGTSSYVTDDTTHHWNDALIRRVTRHKEQMLARARDEQYDFLFLIDSDVLVCSETVEHLIRQHQDIVAEVFWTRWHPDSADMPQVWLMDLYDMHLHRPHETIPLKEAARLTKDFVQMLRRPGVYPVGGLGACTLISRRALLRGVSFEPIPNVSFWGEDRHFCIRAAAMGLGLAVDTHLPAFHVYRDADIPKGEAYLERWSRQQIWGALAQLPRDSPDSAAPQLTTWSSNDDPVVERQVIKQIKAGDATAATWRLLGEVLARQQVWVTARHVLHYAAHLGAGTSWAAPLVELCSRFPNDGERTYVEGLLSQSKYELNLEKYKNTGWGLSRLEIEQLYDILEDMHQDITIVEFGSGLSTEFLVDYSNLRKEKHIRIHSFDDSREFSTKIANDNLTLNIRSLVHCDDSQFARMFEQKRYIAADMKPKTDQPTTTQKNTFYSDVELPATIDLLIVDGPHGNGRSIAFLHCFGKLKKDSYVLIDDATHYPFYAHFDMLFENQVVVEHKNDGDKWRYGGDFIISKIV